MADEDMTSSSEEYGYRSWMGPLNDDQKASARAQVLKGSVHFCRKRLVDPADDLSTVLERLGQPFQDLVAAYRFTGPHQELLDHCLRVLVGNDLVHAKYDDDALIFGMRCILEGVYARTGERFETFDAAYAALAGDVVLSLDRATVAALAAARVSPAAPKGGRTPDGGRTDSGALAGRESPKSSVDGVDLDGEFGAIPKPGGIVWNAMQAKYTPEAFARIIFTWGESKGRASMASREHSEVGLPRPERQEKGGKPPAEFHARPDQLGQFATDWLYQAQLWVQAESFLKPVPKVIT